MIDFYFIGKTLEDKAFVYGNPKELKIGSALASHQFITTKGGNSDFVHVYNRNRHTCSLKKNEVYHIISFQFPSVPQTNYWGINGSDLFPSFFKSISTKKITDFYLKSDVENILSSLVQIYMYFGNIEPFIFKLDLVHFFSEANMDVSSEIHPKLTKLRSEIFWTPRFSKVQNVLEPLLALNQNSNLTNCQPSIVKYVVHMILNSDLNLHPSILVHFPRPSQSRLHFISSTFFDNNYYLISSLDSSKKTCLWIPIPFIIIAFTVSNTDNIGEIIQELESDLDLMSTLANLHNSVSKSFLPKSKESKKKLQYCFYPNTSSFLRGKYELYSIDPQAFTKSTFKLNLNLAHHINAIVRRYLLSFRDSQATLVLGKPSPSKVALTKKYGVTFEDLLNFWIIHKETVAIAFGSAKSVIRSCPAGVNLDALHCNPLTNIQINDAFALLSSLMLQRKSIKNI